MERWQIQQKLYGDFQDWRVNLYQALAEHRLAYDWLHTLAGDLRQMLERVETEMLQAENREQNEER